MIKLSYEQQIAFNSLSIIVGNALYALTVVLFLVPSGLITGGATGIALGINRALGLPVSGVLFVINMTMLTVGWVLLGRRFAITTIASTVLSPLFLALWERVFTGFVLTDDLLLNTIFAGFGVGISLGITIRAGASTGGMDIPPLVLNKYFHIPVSASMLVFDLLILPAGGVQPAAAVSVRHRDGDRVHRCAGQSAHFRFHPYRGQDHQSACGRDPGSHFLPAGPRRDHPAR